MNYLCIALYIHVNFLLIFFVLDNLKITPKSENITTLPEKPVEQNSNTKNDNNISTLANSSLSLQSVNSNACQDNVTENLANTKEKTPMCLVNELARFNKVIFYKFIFH